MESPIKPALRAVTVIEVADPTAVVFQPTNLRVRTRATVRKGLLGYVGISVLRSRLIAASRVCGDKCRICGISIAP
jgi:hypothetical protein